MNSTDRTYVANDLARRLARTQAEVVAAGIAVAAMDGAGLVGKSPAPYERSNRNRRKRKARNHGR